NAAEVSARSPRRRLAALAVLSLGLAILAAANGYAQAQQPAPGTQTIEVPLAAPAPPSTPTRPGAPDPGPPPARPGPLPVSAPGDANTQDPGYTCAETVPGNSALPSQFPCNNDYIPIAQEIGGPTNEWNLIQGAAYDQNGPETRSQYEERAASLAGSAAE